MDLPRSSYERNYYLDVPTARNSKSLDDVDVHHFLTVSRRIQGELIASPVEHTPNLQGARISFIYQGYLKL